MEYITARTSAVFDIVNFCYSIVHFGFQFNRVCTCYSARISTDNECARTQKKIHQKVSNLGGASTTE